MCGCVKCLNCDWDDEGVGRMACRGGLRRPPEVPLILAFSRQGRRDLSFRDDGGEGIGLRVVDWLALSGLRVGSVLFLEATDG